MVSLIYRNTIAKRLMQNFEAHKAAVIRKQVRLDNIHRIKKNFFRYLERINTQRYLRDVAWAKHSLIFLVPIKHPQVETNAKQCMLKFVFHMAGVYQMRQDLARFNNTCKSIQNSIRLSIDYRKLRLDLLFKMFDIERRSMIKYYFDKKNKKLKTLAATI